jgi:hypothetical protein
MTDSVPHTPLQNDDNNNNNSNINNSGASSNNSSETKLSGLDIMNHTDEDRDNFHHHDKHHDESISVKEDLN